MKDLGYLGSFLETVLWQPNVLANGPGPKAPSFCKSRAGSVVVIVAVDPVFAAHRNWMMPSIKHPA